MKDRLEATVERLKQGWGPLPLRSVEHVCSLVKESISAEVADMNVCRAIFSLFLQGIEEKNLEEDAFLSKDDVTKILAEHIGDEHALYYICGHYATPNINPFRDEGSDPDYMTTGAGHFQMVGETFQEVVEKAHESIERMVEQMPPGTTNCTVNVYMVDDGNLITLGQWEWDRYRNDYAWCSAQDRQ